MKRKKIKRLHRISHAVALQIIAEYSQKAENGYYRWTMGDIASRHEISVSSINKLIKAAGAQCRPRGRHIERVPNARTMQILRDLTEPGMTCARVGALHPHEVIINGKRKWVPLSASRISHIARTWRGKLRSAQRHTKGFKPGDIIGWGGNQYVVVEYVNSHRGIVIDYKLEPRSCRVINPYCWIHAGERSILVKATGEELTPEDVLAKYAPYLMLNDGLADHT